MRCDEIMKSNPHSIGLDDPVEAAARIMRDENIGFLPVTDEAKHVVGIVTDRDLAIRVLADDRGHGVRVEEIMTREVIACRPSDNLLRAEQLMSENRKSRIVCVDENGLLAGVISLSDVAQKESDRHIARTMREVTDRESYTVH